MKDCLNTSGLGGESSDDHTVLKHDEEHAINKKTFKTEIIYIFN